MKKKEIYLKAYFRKNLGDDMFIRCISKRYENISFKIATSSNYAQPFESLHNIDNLCCIGRFIDKVTNKIIGKQICKTHREKRANATVHIGGSIFIEPNDFVPPNNLFSNPNLFILGCNFGPHKTTAYHDYIYKRLENATDVCFRDRYSYNEFLELENVRFAPDILFGYVDYPAPVKGEGVGISVINLDERPDLKSMADTYYSVVANTIDNFVQMGIPVKLFSFCEAEGDEKAIQKIVDRCKTKKAEVFNYSGDIDLMLKEINSYEYIVASRFHAMVIGWCLSKKVFPLVYSDKQLNVMTDVNYLGSYLDLRKLQCYKFDNLAEQILGSRATDVKKYGILSDHHFEKLDRFLRENGGIHS